ncbi:hypothetical protein QWI17_21650 [Gilvimarinus sp. SDUM040013]|uniref:Solute-binding protein family 3/N-terminal domain-containing protein n=1 Tax=Gilvimarinus gilvus TaxID=3058038 RepID=A0ABU4RUX5_9GAMM|nr:hypothetical protein [Gilvimarinus sp. SDUM040013]MDO3388466.1 hypothetical protein [Gilvimarinus sp. SDUM040013]MDX6848662.1 hypothetical protein [Gilvimarinus sp. SDUM040013]
MSEFVTLWIDCMPKSSRRVAKALTASVLALFLSCANVFGETIHLVADNWCPYNCEPDSAAPGFMVEIAQRAFADEGISVRYSILPWLRALQDTRNGVYDAVIGASKAEAVDFIFPRIEQAQMRNAFWALSDSPWNFQGMHSLSVVHLAGC